MWEESMMPSKGKEARRIQRNAAGEEVTDEEPIKPDTEEEKVSAGTTKEDVKAPESQPDPPVSASMPTPLDLVQCHPHLFFHLLGNQRKINC